MLRLNPYSIPDNDHQNWPSLTLTFLHRPHQFAEWLEAWNDRGCSTQTRPIIPLQTHVTKRVVRSPSLDMGTFFFINPRSFPLSASLRIQVYSCCGGNGARGLTNAVVKAIKRGLFPTTIFMNRRALVEGINNNISFVHRVHLSIIDRVRHVCSKYNFMLYGVLALLIVQLINCQICAVSQARMTL